MSKLRPVWVFDIDGTLALKGDRRPFDWSRVKEDKPNPAVCAIAYTLLDMGQSIAYISGRSDECYDDTINWLYSNVEHGLDGSVGLFMRAEGDFRRDTVVKREIYDNHIKNEYNVLGVFDDRRSVVKMWRELGLTCFDVADGDF